uniref:Uncharacterized protein n=1 Tax=Solanum lycopersicum TaxID=4081 RepID=A0A3Q7JB27_SOLLC
MCWARSNSQNNINNHTAAQGRQHFASPIASENQNQVDCDNSPMRNLINVDAGFSSSKSIIPSIPQPSFVFDKLKKIRCHDQDRYKKGKALIPVPFDFGVDIL